MIRPSHHQIAHSARRRFLADLAESVSKSTVILSPTLIVGLGGTGAESARRIEKYTLESGMLSHVQFLIFDTDARTQLAADNLPGFEDDEFCLIQLDAIRPILDHPEQHPEIAARFDLDNQTSLHQLRDIYSRGMQHAGQVRPLAAMALLANQETVCNRLQRSFSKLNSAGPRSAALLMATRLAATASPRRCSSRRPAAVRGAASRWISRPWPSDLFPRVTR